MFWNFVRSKIFKNKNILPNISLVIGKCYKIEKINGIVIKENCNVDLNLSGYSKDDVIKILNDNNIEWKEYPHRLSLIGEEIKFLYGPNPIIFDFDRNISLMFDDISDYLGLCAFYKTNVCEKDCTEEEIFKCNNVYDTVCLRDDIVPSFFQYENFRPRMKDEVFELYEGSNDKSYLVSKCVVNNGLVPYKPEVLDVQNIINKTDVIVKYRTSNDCREIVQQHIDYTKVSQSLNNLKKIGYNEKYLKFYYKTWIEFIDAHAITKEDFLASNYETWYYHNIGNYADSFLL